MAEYFKEVNEHTIRGMSLFIVIDSHKKNYGVSLIDLVSMDQIPQVDGPKRDDGLIKGFSTLNDIMIDIEMESEEERIHNIVIAKIDEERDGK